jgi:hypothetical protein
VTGTAGPQRFAISTIVKRAITPLAPQVNATNLECGVCTFDYAGLFSTTVSPVGSTVWPSATGAAGQNNAVTYPAGGAGASHHQILSDLAPNVYNWITTIGGLPAYALTPFAQTAAPSTSLLQKRRASV